MSLDAERAAFEAWYLSRFGNRAGSYDEDEQSYHSMNIQWRFEAWQARASLPAGVPDGELEWPEYHDVAMGCGLEDRGITDRYEAMRYGWDEAVGRCLEAFNNWSAQP